MGSVEGTDARTVARRPSGPARAWRSLIADMPPARDQTRARLSMMQQLMLAGAVLFVVLFAAIARVPGDLALFLIGVGFVFVLTAVTILVPWNALPVWVVGIVPLLDIVAILLMRIAFPQSGLAVLWVFPAMWLASALGLLGYIAANVIVGALFGVILVLEPSTSFSFSLVVLPVLMVAVTTATFFSVRRFLAQRRLLDKQALVLEQSLERTRHQEQLVMQVLDSVDFGVVRIAADGDIAITNEAHERMPLALAGIEGRDVLPAYDADGTTPLAVERMPLVRATRGEVFDNQVIWFGAPDTARRTYSVTSRRMQDSQGRDDGVVVVSRDITTERAALRARDNIVASVSHELRSPLTAIIGYLDLALETDGISQKVRDDLEIATDNAERMIQIISDILSASSSSRSRVDMTISPEEVDLQRLVLDAAHAWEPTALERRITIFRDDVQSAHAYVDPARMRQVVDNLISNAIKYGREGGSVQLAVYGDELASYVLVRDDGIGIAEEDQHRLFQRFFRVQSTVGGTGLGLAICRDIVRAHGGEIIVGSEPGAGSAFLVRLPARVDQQLPPIDPEQALHMSGAVTTAGRSDLTAGS